MKRVGSRYVAIGKRCFLSNNRPDSGHRLLSQESDNGSIGLRVNCHSETFNNKSSVISYIVFNLFNFYYILTNRKIRATIICCLRTIKQENIFIFTRYGICKNIPHIAHNTP